MGAGLPWVQVDSGFSTSLGVMVAAQALDMDPRTFTGAMVDVQDWAVRNLPTGRFGASASSGQSADVPGDWLADESLWPSLLERVARWTGAPGAFWDALLRTGFLVREGASVRLTLCDRYVQVFEKRRKDAERKRAARAAAASRGRPTDAPGTAPQKRKRESESQKTSTAAAGGDGVSAGRPRAVPAPAPSRVPAEPLAAPVQRALPGTHLVTAGAPRESRPAAQEARGAAEAQPAEPAEGAAAVAFLEDFQDARSKAFPGTLREPPSPAVVASVAEALRELGGDAERLLVAARSYLGSEWARGRQPVGTVQAFLGRESWRRYCPAAAEPPPEDVPVPGTWAGARWAEILAELRAGGRRYVVGWLARARPVDTDAGELVLELEDEHARAWLEGECGEMVGAVAARLGVPAVRWVAAAPQSAGGAS